MVLACVTCWAVSRTRIIYMQIRSEGRITGPTLLSRAPVPIGNDAAITLTPSLVERTPNHKALVYSSGVQLLAQLECDPHLLLHGGHMACLRSLLPIPHTEHLVSPFRIRLSPSTPL